ncbi:S8 family peptidase [Priestia taiwanensis]|uniref:microbial collagenase n=1 Tax=Priestia taiwanensis TaxID=1347902 RepID=A0A917EP58_9BACI|nr:S8 family serine peptidase [Priestia taiwanensis]MBM7362362.1 hypothetical protein [Priestia taiwanensis]GGE61577.1 serine protease [Priestia taiwanensis]
MKRFKRILVATTILTAVIGLGTTTTIVSAAPSDAIEQKKESNLEKGNAKQLIVKFKNEVDLPYEDGLEQQIESEKNDSTLEAVFSEFPDLTLTRLFTSVNPKEIQKLTENGKKHDNHSSSNLLNYYVVQIPKGEQAETLLEKLKKSPLIEDVYIKDLKELAPPEIKVPNLSLKPLDDPRFKDQGYLKAAPYGINAPFAWSIKGGDGKGTTFVDMEYGWLLNHEDLVNQKVELMSGQNINQHVGHGTSVLGIVSAEDNEKGNIGIAPKAKVKVISQIRDNGDYNTADAILSAVNNLNAGDVLLLEAQAAYEGYGDNYLPVEVHPDVFDAIRTGTDKGIIIIEAGGNGGNDLDQFRDRNGKQVLNRNSKDFKDSGAIIVGAGSSDVPHERLWFSNYGSRIDVYGWGENVDTTSATENSSAINLYTSSFSGTSSASPIIAGAAISIQGIAKENLGKYYTPSQLRKILSNTGTGTKSKNPFVDKIGVLPDLKAILVNLGFESKVSDSESPEISQVTEQEPNNQPKEANTLEFNKMIKGTLNDGDNTDVYTFNVNSTQKINIFTLNEKQTGMTWVLHHESNLQDYVAYGQNNGNVIKGTYEAKPGKYYLYVYKYDNKNGSYSLSVN